MRSVVIMPQFSNLSTTYQQYSIGLKRSMRSSFKYGRDSSTLIKIQNRSNAQGNATPSVCFPDREKDKKHIKQCFQSYERRITRFRLKLEFHVCKILYFPHKNLTQSWAFMKILKSNYFINYGWNEITVTFLNENMSTYYISRNYKCVNLTTCIC